MFYVYKKGVCLGNVCVSLQVGFVHLHPAGGAESDRSKPCDSAANQGGHGRLKIGFVAEAAACRGSPPMLTEMQSETVHGAQLPLSWVSKWCTQMFLSSRLSLSSSVELLSKTE